ncbi:SLC19A2 (predicted) [Pycnogonum litorale]
MPGIKVVTGILCSYGFFKEIRPSESFLTEYLEGRQWVNLTSFEVNHQVYPVWIYGYLALLIPVFLLTDYLRYKPLILLEGMAYVSTWILLIVGKGVATMQLMQFVYGIATSTEVAYYTYIYAMVAKDDYQRITSYVRGSLAQLLTSLKMMDYYQLNFVSLGSVYICLFLSNALPLVSHSIYFHRRKSCTDGEAHGHDPDTSTLDNQPPQNLESCSINNQDHPGTLSKLKLMLTHVKEIFVDKILLKWCVWWAVATSATILVGNNIQPLWETIYPSNTKKSAHIYNGIVDACHTLLGAIAALAVGHIKIIDWSKYGEIILCLISILDALLLFFMAKTDHIILCYILYVCFRTTYQLMITVASFEVARRLKDERFGLIFGVNTFVALLISTIITSVLIDKSGIAASPIVQFQVYGAYFLLMGVIYGAIFVYGAIRNRWR